MGKADKSHTIFVCQQCGYESLKWLGRCPNCQEWNSLVEKTVIAPSSRPASRVNLPRELSQVAIEAADRFPLPSAEFN
ncbi:unnamed protein product, partial [marine sediment metagenome]